ncbi:hypothetical protein B0A48_09504 [Cryoendolithus antarcticus]|uniref:Metallo-beta-lactamase domain-containing protein n=1 Tax=Cryoendolithus antarcticus TaxID=1507870 RepID=A0A1V8T099_9PEZI|nr:hypothetical protein B0A48_09504 [Cryoendolithus antarcticus]
MSSAARAPVKVQQTASPNSKLSADKSHHVGKPRTSFTNPWPSAGTKAGLGEIFSLRFGSGHPEKKFVPVPQGPNGGRSQELVKVVKPDWGAKSPSKLRTTWLGHAGFLVETPTPKGADRGIRILFDPVFSERTSPSQLFGPKRYSPPPCTLEELPIPDMICISHNHYDHLDFATIASLWKRSNGSIHFITPLGTKPWFETHLSVPAFQISDPDWWDSYTITVPSSSDSVKITATPAQHTSGRTISDKDKSLWCGYTLHHTSSKRSLYFAGDTAYQAQASPSPCPAFKQVGQTLGPFDLALLPIGLMTPASFMGGVHATPEQSLIIHGEVKAHLSIGMHYGTVRGGLSGQFEAVTDPPRRWRAAAMKANLWAGGGVEGDGEAIDVAGGEVGLCNIGETVSV